ncbi:hypothetical protein PSTG_06673 [Puccinia striiformis f. sp. tritici PST-78]|uniref:Uncharacterized protein n=1 Tax=Puccinia striiformis f. sp. tritici PST-78 TaxID=1165861 RepID=A0A0L0VL99_9BASI|nr:hypothetical protein PSTG_06673 [Puccinia striiformis f. sp. tritici PST-78]
MDWITHRPELATPVTGWKQLKELFQEGLDPYDSGVFHQVEAPTLLVASITPPILVHPFTPILVAFGLRFSRLLFCVDILPILASQCIDKSIEVNGRLQ